jgi:mono/diheme cytochrome c family protein
MSTINRFLAIGVALVCSTCCSLELSATTNSESSVTPTGNPTAPVSFYHDVRPILQARCQGCHQPAKAGGGYVMTSVEAMQRDGESELTAIVTGKPEASFLIEQITPTDGVASMPAEGVRA